MNLKIKIKKIKRKKRPLRVRSLHKDPNPTRKKERNRLMK